MYKAQEFTREDRKVLRNMSKNSSKNSWRHSKISSCGSNKSFKSKSKSRSHSKKSSKHRVSMTNISSFLHEHKKHIQLGRSRSLAQEFKPLRDYRKIMCSGEFDNRFPTLPLPKDVTHKRGRSRSKSKVNQIHHTTISGNNFMTILHQSSSAKKKYQKPSRHYSPIKNI